MATINFEKFQGSGNDFIMVDNRKGAVADADKRSFVTTLCPRATAVGADGVIFLEDDDELDFKWHFFNADGSEAEMCGNGSRCMAVYANGIGAAGSEMVFRTIAGPISAKLVDGGAKVQLTDAPAAEKIESIDLDGEKATVYFLNTGVPHVVEVVDDLEAVDVKKRGALLRYHQQFAPAGSNVNFISRDGDSSIAIRTYERGVEDETLACGTGSVASAIVSADVWGMSSPVTVRTRSGIVLNISFETGAEKTTGIFLEGPAVRVYRGNLEWPTE